MKLYTNDLWIQQVIYFADIHFGGRNRGVKVVLTYDYVSRYILDTEVYLFCQAETGRMDLYKKVQKYGIPNSILYFEQKSFHKGEDEIKHSLGINMIFTEGEGSLEAEAIMYDSGDIFDEIKDAKTIMEQRFSSFENRIYESYHDLVGTIKRSVENWNGQGGKSKSPYYIYYSSMEKHIYMDEAGLESCYLYKCTARVSSHETLNVLGKEYQAPKNTSGKMLSFYVSQFQKRKIFLYDEEERKVVCCCLLI